MNKVSIITVNYNQRQVTDDLLNSIIKYNTYYETEIIVVDNGSDINSKPYWKVKYPNFIFIRSEKNLGFAGGNNLGIQSATGDFLFLVNNDTIFTPNLIDILVQTLLMNSQVGIISPKLLYFDQPHVLQYVGYTEMNYYTAINSCIGQYEIDNGQYDSVIGKTAFAHGAAMMVRRSVINKVGLMADNSFLYYEELDWCERAKKAGFEIWINTNVSIYHKESISVGKKSALKEYFMNRNRILFIRRNAPLFPKILFFFYFILFVIPRNILSYFKDNNFNYSKQLFRAIYWNFTNSVKSNYLGYRP
jgi:hypothetical protein